MRELKTLILIALIALGMGSATVMAQSPRRHSYCPRE